MVSNAGVTLHVVGRAYANNIVAVSLTRFKDLLEEWW